MMQEIRSFGVASAMVDAFARANRDVFFDAVEKLADSFEDTIIRGQIKQVGLLYGLGLYAPNLQNSSLLDTIPPTCVAPILTAYFHLTAGAPLRLDLALLSSWGADWDGIACSVCLTCGYHFPRTRCTCSICGGVVGTPADWEGRRVRAAVN